MSRSDVWFELAEQDLGAARKLLDVAPNLAAFHAQQCVEKAVKAIDSKSHADEKDYREVARKRGHQPIRTLSNILAQLPIHPSVEGINTISDESVRQALISFVSELGKIEISEILTELSTTRSTSRNEEIWRASLDESVHATISLPPELAQKTGEGEIIMNNAIGALAPTLVGLGISPPTGSMVDTPVQIEFLQSLADALRSKGLAKRAEELLNVESNLEELAPFLRLVGYWAPYLCAHVEFGRYPDSEKLQIYRDQKVGVRNLIEKAEQILEQSRRVAEFWPNLAQPHRE